MSRARFLKVFYSFLHLAGASGVGVSFPLENVTFVPISKFGPWTTRSPVSSRYSLLKVNKRGVSIHGEMLQVLCRFCVTIYLGSVIMNRNDKV